MREFHIALAGNPNVGKSTIFNALTGLNQHTGNWTGKTVECFEGYYTDNDTFFAVTDLPGAYSLASFSQEEEVTRRCLTEKHFDCVVIVIDAGTLERNLRFAMEVLSLQTNAVICLNLYDEAQRKGLSVDTERLSQELHIPVVKSCATKKHGLNELKRTVKATCGQQSNGTLPCYNVRTDSLIINRRCKEIAEKCVMKTNAGNKATRDRKIDKILTSKLTGIPIMLLLCGLLFWITAIGANVPSEWLSKLFALVKEQLNELCRLLAVPKFLSGLLIDGIYTTLSWVVAVMLPPMAIFFPLFSLIEDSGYLPRIAFNLDRFFSKCGAHGKQSLTMMMGIGCNACGVTGCRIIESKKERLIAVLTNNFMPCNGRLPILIALIMMYFAGSSFGLTASVKVAVILVGVLAACVMITLLVSKILSVLLPKKIPSGFALELPPYRKPQIMRTIVRSFLDRTLFVLGRAVIVAAPAGALIWLCANITVGEMSVLTHLTHALNPFGKFLGLDGVILMAFILGFPANETVIPIMIMAYLANGTLVDYASYEELLHLFTQNGWTTTTAVCMMIMTVMHFPCSTTCLTIKKETGSLKWTALSMLIPTVTGMLLCAIVSHILP